MTPEKYVNCMQMRKLNDQFDAFICGSDQIWNAACTGGLDPVYFLQFADQNKRKIAYAPSIAHMTMDNEIQTRMCGYLQGLHAISVREESTVSLIQNLTMLPVEVTLDPTLLLDAVEYDRMIQEKQPEENYIFVYMLESNAAMVDYICRLSKAHALKVFYIAKESIDVLGQDGNMFGVSPEEFLSRIRHAKYVVTNSFHATVFSILFKKQFMTFGTQHSYTRMVDLLKKLGLEDRIYTDGNDIDCIIDYVALEKTLMQLRERSVDYLKRALWDNE